MRGFVSSEFVDFVGARAGDEVVDDMIERAYLSAGGTFCDMSKDDWQDVVQLAATLFEITEVPVSDLMRAFGRHLFERLNSASPELFSEAITAFGLLEGVECRIRKELLKLHPDAELPTVEVRQRGDRKFAVAKSSCRHYGHLCLGMIEGREDHFGQRFEIVHGSESHDFSIWVRLLDRMAA